MALPGHPRGPAGRGQQRRAVRGGDPGRPVRDGPLLPDLRAGHLRLGGAQGPPALRPRPAHPTRRAAGRLGARPLARGDLGVASDGRRFGVVLDGAERRRADPRHGPDVVRRGPARLLARLRRLAVLARAPRDQEQPSLRLAWERPAVWADARRARRRNLGGHSAGAPRLPHRQPPGRPIPPVAMAAVRDDSAWGSSPPSTAGSTRYPTGSAADAALPRSAALWRGAS